MNTIPLYCPILLDDVVTTVMGLTKIIRKFGCPSECWVKDRVVFKSVRGSSPPGAFVKQPLGARHSAATLHILSHELPSSLGCLYLLRQQIRVEHLLCALPVISESGTTVVDPALMKMAV